MKKLMIYLLVLGFLTILSTVPTHAKNPDQNGHIHLSNPYTDRLPSSLVLFSDSTQTFFESPPGSDYRDMLYPVLDPKNKSVIEIRTPFGSRLESLWAINVENPYVQLEPEAGVMTQLPTYVKISNLLRFQK